MRWFEHEKELCRVCPIFSFSGTSESFPAGYWWSRVKHLTHNLKIAAFLHPYGAVFHHYPGA